MKTSHINHVVLYAKNWYRHTGDLVVDLAQMMRLDHPEKRILVKKEIYEQMMTDYREWIESIEDARDRQYKMKEFEGDDFGVRWEEDRQLSQMWAILISYSIYIKDYGSQLLPPVYDFNNNLYSQYDLYPVNPFGAIPRDAPESEYIKAAKRYLDAPLVTHMKNSFMSAMYDFDFDLVIKAIKAVTPEESVRSDEDTVKRIRGMMYKLWNIVRKKVRDGVYTDYYNTERVGPLMAYINTDRCEFDMAYVVVWGVADAEIMPEILSETDKCRQMEMLFDRAASRLNRSHLKEIFKIDNYSGVGLHIGKRTDVTPDEFIDDHIRHLKECYLNLEDKLVSCSHMKAGIFNCATDVENMKVTIWYPVVDAFGCHEYSLRNKCHDFTEPHM